MPSLEDVVDEIPFAHGAVGLLSGDEFLPPVEEFDRALIAAAGPRVALLLCADPRAAPKSANLGVAHYRRLGAEPIVLDVLAREQARAGALPDYDVLFLAGGDPSTLLACLRGTPLWEEAVARWRRGVALAGASAGAMALCRHCLEPEPGAFAPTRWSRGLGPLERFAVACHASSRPREWLRRITATAQVPVVALDDHTGLILAPGAAPRVAGPGGAWPAEAVRSSE